MLGVDPGLAKTGWGVVRFAGRRAEFVASGVVRTAAADAHIVRLRAIGDGLRAAAAEFSPDVVCVERVFVNTNPGSSLLLGEARGAALLALAQFAENKNAAVVELTALQIKHAVAGAGRADKKQIAVMVGRLLGVSVDKLSADETDALACALAATALQDGVFCLGRRQGRRGGRRGRGGLRAMPRTAATAARRAAAAVAKR